MARQHLKQLAKAGRRAGRQSLILYLKARHLVLQTSRGIDRWSEAVFQSIVFSLMKYEFDDYEDRARQGQKARRRRQRADLIKSREERRQILFLQRTLN